MPLLTVEKHGLITPRSNKPTVRNVYIRASVGGVAEWVER